MAKGSLKLVGWAVAGAAVGAAVALLAAPASGKETRRKIAETMGDQADVVLRKSRDSLERAADFLESRLEDGQRRLLKVG
jgi:gas vesicle protein